MDDLDHSMHIAEYDWTSFYDESEECRLMQPSLACPDDSSLSDSETSSPVFSNNHQETQQNLGAESNAARCSAEGESCVTLLSQLSKSDTGAEHDVTAAPKEESATQVDSGISIPEENTFKAKDIHVKHAEETTESNTNRFQTELLQDQSSGVSKQIKKEDGDQCAKSDNYRSELNTGFLKQTELHMNKLHAAEGPVTEGVSSAVSRGERERWFVTVNDSRARPRIPAASVKKKLRQKKASKKTYSSMHENRFEINMCGVVNKHDKMEFEGGRATEAFIQSNPTLVQSSSEHPNAEINPNCDSESSQMSCKADKVSERLARCHSLKDNGTDPAVDRNKQEPGSSAFRIHDTFTPKYPSQVESIDSDELEDGVEFCSVDSNDSETYLSAAESVEETPHPLKAHLIENQQLPTKASYLLNVADIKGREIQSCGSTLYCNALATSCDSYKSTTPETALAFPSAGQRANKMPDDNSTCDNDTHSMELLQQHKLNVSASGSSSGGQLRPFPVPDLTVTPGFVADSPETYVRASGHTPSVYAISAFWNEMEKLTIHDILQLREGGSTHPSELQETVTTNVDDSSLVDTKENPLSASCVMDTSDSADSDYFTQPDEYKPDCSSCEFSLSDFEEEYWQFIGNSRNHSPEPGGKSRQRVSYSPFLSRRESSSTCSEGKETPVPLEDFAEQCFVAQDSHLWPRQMIKSKTVHNIALNTEDLDLQVNDRQETLIPEPVLSNTDMMDKQISITEVPDYFFTEDKEMGDFTCATVYNPEDISVVPVFDCTLRPFRDEMSFSFLYDCQHSEVKPIPIFSCSYPTVRELAFPKPDYVVFNTDCKKDISPIRLVSHSFTKPTACGTAGSRSLLSIRKIHFHDKGSMRSTFEVIPSVACFKRGEPLITALTEKRVSATPVQLFRELEGQQRIWGTTHTIREGIFSTLKQSDMCLVCIAFASWVLKSSDPDAADAWKSALLANLSALSAIRFLRQYVKKNNPSHDDP